MKCILWTISPLLYRQEIWFTDWIELILNKTWDNFVLRQHSLYSLVNDSSDELKMCPTRKKKLTFVCFFIFSSDMTKSVGFLFTKSVVFSSKNGQNRQKMSDMSHLWDLYFYFFFPPTWLKNPYRDSWTKEYSECCLRDVTDWLRKIDQENWVSARSWLW